MRLGARKKFLIAKCIIFFTRVEFSFPTSCLAYQNLQIIKSIQRYEGRFGESPFGLCEFTRRPPNFMLLWSPVHLHLFLVPFGKFPFVLTLIHFLFPFLFGLEHHFLRFLLLEDLMFFNNTINKMKTQNKTLIDFSLNFHGT